MNDTQKFPYYSFCYGRGTRFHKTEEAAKRAAKKDANTCQRTYGGNKPAHDWGNRSELQPK